MNYVAGAFHTPLDGEFYLSEETWPHDWARCHAAGILHDVGYYYNAATLPNWACGPKDVKNTPNPGRIAAKVGFPIARGSAAQEPRAP